MTTAQAAWISFWTGFGFGILILLIVQELYK